MLGCRIQEHVIFKVTLSKTRDLSRKCSMFQTNCGIFARIDGFINVVWFNVGSDFQFSRPKSAMGVNETRPFK